MGATKTDLFTAEQNELANMAKAIAHPARIAILQQLIKTNACICGDLVDELGLAQPTISQHLKELKSAGIIQGRVEGTSVCYCINPQVWKQYQQFFSEFFIEISNHLNKTIMKLSEIKSYLHTAESVNFQLPDGSFVPGHFHVTEVGIITKHFIDCGGTVRHEKVANFQLWNANDFEHRLKAGKLLNIIALSEKVLGMEDLEIEVEYQGETIGKYDLGFDGTNFLLRSKQTACLASDKCGIPQEKKKIAMVELGVSAENTCTPGGGCC